MTFPPTDPSTELPKPTPRARKLALAWSATDMADSNAASAMLKVAFATANRATVDQHFGAARGFALYALDAGRAKLVEVLEFPEESMDGNESKLGEKIAALAGCAAVYCLAVGGSAVRQLLAAGIQPVRIESETAIDTLIADVQEAMRVGGVGWIARALRRPDDGSRFERMAEEGWAE